MSTAELKESHTRLEKLLKFQEDTHRKTFTHVTSEGAYRASCDKVSSTYQDLVEVGAKLGIFYPKRMSP